MRIWSTRFEWKSYARCDDTRWITPPERLSEHDREWVEFNCHQCKVRPECVAEVVAEESSGVWCASVFIPEVSVSDSPRRAKQVLAEAAEVRLRLGESVAGEIERRGEF